MKKVKGRREFAIKLRRWDNSYELYCYPLKAWDIYRYFYSTINKSRILLTYTEGMDCFSQSNDEKTICFADLLSFKAPFIPINNNAALFDGNDFVNLFFSMGIDLYPDIFSFLIFKKDGTLQRAAKDAILMKHIEETLPIIIRRDSCECDICTGDFNIRYDALGVSPINKMKVEYFIRSHDDESCTLWMRNMADIRSFIGRYLYEFLANDYKGYNVVESYSDKQFHRLSSKQITQVDDECISIMLEYIENGGIYCFVRDIEVGKKMIRLKIWKNLEKRHDVVNKSKKHWGEFFYLEYDFVLSKWSIGDIYEGRKPDEINAIYYNNKLRRRT